MSFRLRPSHPVGRELRRLIRREFDLALRGLARQPPGEADVFEARKSLKKIRAILRLVRRELRSDYAAQNALLRRASHRLATLRDAEATAQTLAALGKRYPKRLQRMPTDAAVRALRARVRRLETGSPAGLRLATREIQRVRKSFLADLDHVKGFAKVRAGITSGYRRARRALKGLSEDANAARFHVWRRRVKTHWYHVRLFEGVSGTARTRGARLGRLETQLGDDHNLAMLRKTLVASAGQFGDMSWKANALECAAQADRRLRRQALRLGAALFAAKPAAFRRDVTRWRP